MRSSMLDDFIVFLQQHKVDIVMMEGDSINFRQMNVRLETKKEFKCFELKIEKNLILLSN